jgi:epoxyqueuosine reductase
MGRKRPVIAAPIRPPSLPAPSLNELIKAQAYGLGFDLAGITRLGPVESAPLFEQWVARGYAGEMDYLPRGAEKRRDSRLPFAGALSAVVVGLNYGGTTPSGPVARYARGDDYHDIMWRKLDSLHESIEKSVGFSVSGKSYVDTGPILERDLARRAGLGWFGKNTNLLNPKIGSFFFIGALLLGLDLEPDAPFEADRCGTCTRCLDACPTDAFVSERVLDATRCISYLTIESRGAIPLELREEIGSLLYGCDICQDVCPWNQRFAKQASVPLFDVRPALSSNDAVAISRDILGMDDLTFRAAFKSSPMKRARLRGLKRNAAVVLGNVGTVDDVAALRVAAQDSDPLLAGHAAWAVSRIVDKSHEPVSTSNSLSPRIASD